MSMANTRTPKTRRGRTEKFLSSCGIFMDPKLPKLLDEETAKPRPTEDTVKRAVCAFCTARAALAIRCEQDSAAKLCAGVITRFSLESELTPNERKYFEAAAENAPGISEEEAEKFHWRAERSMPLIWACGLLGENDLEFPWRKTDTDPIFRLLNSYQSFSELMSKVKPHSLTEILDNMDQCFGMVGACIAAEASKKPSLRGNVNSKVVEEQLKGFSWLVGLKGFEDWDNIDI